MATRSTIAVKDEDGKVSQIYCHWDGYLSHNGEILVNHYDSLELAKQLVSLGSLSVLRKRIEPLGLHSFDNPEENTCVYYGRDRGEDNTAPDVYWSEELYQVSGQVEEYNYLFKDGEWHLYDFDSKKYSTLAKLFEDETDV